jgi:CspA family cold shock protein|uniref:cold-shock protein n=1 Tax=Halioglobus sp. Uisw_031 TaxID=3230977 RepID=UPI003FEFEA3A|tara:strand:- start:6 stop:428 length:423 start_codon:yes stop_codon:yes gene_type:complete
MSLITKLIISLVIAVIASTLTTLVLSGQLFEPQMLVAFFVATTATALLVRDNVTHSGSDSDNANQPQSTSDASRDRGTVKWFNVSKGFGFITKDDGEEIFVHFRSIRGEGRRGLRDGQTVSFVVTDSDKGPQAEDVLGED